MDHFRRIYTREASAYQRLIAAEDADGRLTAFLEEKLRPYWGRNFLDLGGGTGRFGRLFAQQSGQFLSVDLYEAMLREQEIGRRAAGHRSTHWQLVQTDMSALPLPDGWADALLAGWSLGHSTGWYPDNWPLHIDRVLAEMERVASPGALLCICETMTTGSLTPAPPTPALAAYYQRLEEKWGYGRHILSTDYQFESVGAAVAATEFFFGEDLSRLIHRHSWSRLPEWTGVWLKKS